MRKTPPEIKLSPEELRRMQLIQLSILKEVDRICRKHSINYFLISGTLLGAVRHKGFIPWDDDLDVGFLRDDYERFCVIFAQETDSEKYFCQTWKTDPNYFWGYGKIRRLGTDYVRLGQEHMKYVRGINIDIFPFDNLPEIDKEWYRFENSNKYNLNYLLKNTSFINKQCYKQISRQAYMCLVCRKGAYSRVGKYQAKERRIRFLYSIMSLIPERFYASLLDKWAQKYNSNKNDIRCVMQFGYPEILFGIESSMFSELVEIEFERHMFMTVKEADAYLIMHYGDYMKLPPPEERIGVAPLSKIDFGNIEI